MNQPSHGIRFELVRAPAPEGQVRYEVSLLGPDATCTTLATVKLDDGAVELQAFAPSEPPAWSLATLRAFLRGEWRSRRDDPGDPWPERITRWRTER